MGRQDQSSLSLSTVPNEMLGGGGTHRDGPTAQKEADRTVSAGRSRGETTACPLCSLRVTTQMPIWVANVRPNGMKRSVYMDFHFYYGPLVWPIPHSPVPSPDPSLSVFLLHVLMGPWDSDGLTLCLSNLRPLFLPVERAVPGILHN